MDDGQKTQRDMELLDLREVLNTGAGRRLLWKIIDWTGCEGTPLRTTQDLTYMAIGSGDVGRWIKSEIISADENYLFTMIKENMEAGNGRVKGRSSGNGRSSNERKHSSDDGRKDDGR